MDDDSIAVEDDVEGAAELFTEDACTAAIFEATGFAAVTSFSSTEEETWLKTNAATSASAIVLAILEACA